MAAPSTKARTGTATKPKAAATKEKSSGELTDEAEKAAAKKAAEAEKESKREEAARAKQEAEEKARAAKIESGDLIEGDGVDFEKSTKETKVSAQIAHIVDQYKETAETGVPLKFTDAVANADGKYPEDLLPVMHGLEHLGMVERFGARDTTEGATKRSTAAYLWVGPVE